MFPSRHAMFLGRIIEPGALDESLVESAVSTPREVGALAAGLVYQGHALIISEQPSSRSGLKAWRRQPNPAP